MASYKVLKPVAFAEGGKGRSVRPGAVVELSDSVAKDLGSRVERVDGQKSDAKTEPKKPDASGQ